MFKSGYELFICYLLISVFASESFARVLLISDVDDTIKISRVNSIKNKAGLAFAVDSRFRGMSELYNALADEHPNTLEQFYLSNAPSWLMQIPHESFLDEGDFPRGVIQLRQSESEDNHKLFFLRRWIKTLSPQVVILIGDNGERDALFYNQVVSEFSNEAIQFLQFIRIVYDDGHQLFPNQIGFVTPLEITLELLNQGLLSSATGRSLIQKFETQILSEKKGTFGRPSYFPYWLECSEWQAPVSSFYVDPLVIEKIANECDVNI